MPSSRNSMAAGLQSSPAAIFVRRRFTACQVIGVTCERCWGESEVRRGRGRGKEPGREGECERGWETTIQQKMATLLKLVEQIPSCAFLRRFQPKGVQRATQNDKTNASMGASCSAITPTKHAGGSGLDPQFVHARTIPGPPWSNRPRTTQAVRYR